MRLGYNTNGFAHHRLEDAVCLLHELGYSSVALTLDYHALDPFSAIYPRQRDEIAHLLRNLQLHSVIETGARFLLDIRRKHQPTLLDPDTAQREHRLDFLRRAVDLARDLGSDCVSFWSGTPLDTSTEHLGILVDGCRRLADYAGARDVRLAFEPEPGMLVDTMPRFAGLHELVHRPNFGLTLDIGHLHCLGEVPIEAHLRHWRDWIWNVHLEDMRRGVHDHLPFGSGEIDFGPVLRTLAEIEYTGGIHVELSRHSHDAVETARRSLAFLRTTLAGVGEDNAAGRR